MAQIADVQIYECDGADCHAMYAVKDENTLIWFGQNWHEGPLCHFCPECKVKPESQPKIAEEYEFVKANVRLLDPFAK